MGLNLGAVLGLNLGSDIGVLILVTMSLFRGMDLGRISSKYFQKNFKKKLHLDSTNF